MSEERKPAYYNIEGYYPKRGSSNGERSWENWLTNRATLEEARVTVKNGMRLVNVPGAFSKLRIVAVYLEVVE